MNKSNVTKNTCNTADRTDPFSLTTKYQCPICKKTVLQEDFISSYRLVSSLADPVYQIVNLCRECRDSGL